MLESIFSDKELLAEINKVSRLKHYKAGEIVLEPGGEIYFLPIIVEGSLRILKVNDNGGELFLYHLYPGQTCAMSINCCQTGGKSSIKIVAEEETDVVQIPVKMVDGWLKYAEWKFFINGTYGQRFSELINVINLIAFSNMDKLLFNYLVQRCRAKQSNLLSITHKEIADEMHAHREAISRLLRTMEQKGIVRLGRNTIEMLDQSWM
jgi:cAMP-binding proteins - catabolite gene activator and regulatory subunit of cAMP-dependent protein kinases